MKISFGVLFFFLLENVTHSQNADRTFFFGPDSLIQHAASVLINEQQRIEISSPETATLIEYKDVLVLNDEGKSDGYFYDTFDKYHLLDKIEVDLLDASGKKIRSYDEKDMKNVSNTSDESIVEDERAYLLPVQAASFPYHVVTTYTIKINGFISLPTWYPQHESQSIMHASLLVKVPTSYSLNYRTQNYSLQPKQSSRDGVDFYEWELQNIPAAQSETQGPSWIDQAISVDITPTKFSFDGKEGSAANWQVFGSWFCDLYKGQQELPPEVLEKVNSLVKGINDPKQKVKELYEFMQQNVHYFAVELGLGGWQPLSASYVAKNGFGDCKALSNYMHSLLQAVNIPSYPVLINAGAGESDINETFPSNQFSHAILMVPLPQDTIWLECTNPDIPFNFLSFFTEHRHGLALEPNGGILVKTPSTTMNENVADYELKVDISNLQLVKTDLDASYSGNEGLLKHQRIEQLASDKQLDEFREQSGLPNFNVEAFNFFPFNSDSISGSIKLSAVFPEFVQSTSTRIFFNPFLIGVWKNSFQQNKPRRFPVRFYFPYQISVTEEFNLPEGYHVESLPKDVGINDDYLIYETHITQTSSTISIRYKFGIKVYSIPAHDFDAFNTSINKILSDQRKKIVLVKNS